MYFRVCGVCVSAESPPCGGEEAAAGLSTASVRTMETVSPWKPAAVGGATERAKLTETLE